MNVDTTLIDNFKKWEKEFTDDNPMEVYNSWISYNKARQKYVLWKWGQVKIKDKDDELYRELGVKR